jgi:hypothetical protein
MSADQDISHQGKHVPPRQHASGGELTRNQPGALLASLRASFSSQYLTLTSIIQGVALAYLVVVVDEEMTQLSAAQWLLVVTAFLAIVSAWHEYMTAVTIFVWVPRLWDSLIPFLVGGSELMLIRSLRRPGGLEWSFLALGVVALVTLLAFLNMYRSAAAEEDLNRDLLVRMRSYRRLTLAFVIAAGVLLFLFAAVEAAAGESTSLDVVLSAGALGLVLAFVIRGYFHWNRVIQIAREDSVGERLR